jgi:hypothetical protein
MTVLHVLILLSVQLSPTWSTIYSRKQQPQQQMTWMRCLEFSVLMVWLGFNAHACGLGFTTVTGGLRTSLSTV